MSKRLMPTYLIKFLENLYNGNRPLDFTRVMVTRQFIAKLKELYKDLGGNQPENYTQVLVPKYLQDFFNELEIIEFDDDDISQTKTIPNNLVYPACRIDSIGGMSYKTLNVWNEETVNGAIIDDGSIDTSLSTRLTTSFIEVKPNTTYYFSSSMVRGRSAFYDINKELISYSYDGLYYNINVMPSNVYYVRITFPSVYGSTYKNDSCVIISDSSKNGNYYPYFTGLRDSAVTAVKSYNTDNELLDTYTVPSAITSLEGYGQGINDTVYNNVDFANGKYIKKVGVVDLGTLTWYGSNGFFQVSTSAIKKPASQTTNANLLCPIYDVDNAQNIYTNVNDKRIGVNADNGYLQVRDNSYTSVSDFKASMNGVYLYYELATPTETNITENAPLLEVEDGGTVVFENEYNQDVPSEVTTWIKES